MALSSELEQIKNYIENSKDSINAKYQEAGLPLITNIKASQLKERIDAIPVVRVVDENLKPENIKPGVTIFDVTGNGPENQIDVILHEENSTVIIPEGWHKQGIAKIQVQEKTAIPSNKLVIIEPDDDHVLSRVFIEGDEDLLSENIKAGITIYGVTGNQNIIDTNDGTATNDDILLGKTAYVKGEKVTGTIISIPEKTYTPTTTDQIITKKQYLEGDQIIKGDPNLLSNNIIKGVSIFGVQGNSNVIDTSGGNATSPEILIGKTAYVKGELVTGSMPSKDTEIFYPTTHDQTINPGVYLSGIQTIKGDSNLKPENIKSGVSIFGIAGTLEEALPSSGIKEIYVDKNNNTFTDTNVSYDRISVYLDQINIIYVINENGFIAVDKMFKYGIPLTVQTPSEITGLTVKGWSKNPIATSIDYNNGDIIDSKSYPRGSNVILYAVISFDPPTDITLTTTFSNSGKLDSSGKETVRVTIHGGDSPCGLSVTKTLGCDRAVSITKVSENVYDLTFNEPGYYTCIAMSTDTKGQSKIGTTTFPIKNNSGNMNGAGVFQTISGDNGGVFVSNWVGTNIIKGCYVSKINYKLYTGGGHSAASDKLVILGKRTDGSIIVIYDFDDRGTETCNTGRILDKEGSWTLTNNNSGKTFYGYTLSSSPEDSSTVFSLNPGNLGNTHWDITKTFTEADDIRQVEFFAYASPGHYSCVTNADISYDVEYEFSIDLYSSDR